MRKRLKIDKIPLTLSLSKGESKVNYARPKSIGEKDYPSTGSG